MTAALIFFAVFFSLKVFGTVDWSWWVITAPLWLWFLASLIVASINRDNKKGSANG